MSFFKEFIKTTKTILVPHYIGNIILATLFFVLKTVHPVCTYLFSDCTLELKEWEMITFLGCIIVLKNRKQVAAGEFISTACLFGKALSLLLFYQYSAIYGVLYGLACLLHFIFLPQPMYKGPEFVTYFRGPHLTDEIERDKRITWVICFYAAWSPPCVTVAPMFAEISAEYQLDNLKFGKLDVSRYPEIGNKYSVDNSSWSKQLPTLVVFQEGKEKMRRPYVTPKGHVLKFPFTKELIIKEFELNDIYNQCKKNPLKVRKDKNKDKEQKQD